MANITKLNPIGIDVHIQNIQNSVYNEFNTSFGNNWNSYGRVYRNYDDNGTYEPRPHSGNGEYVLDNFFDDKVSITSFFDIGEKIKYNEENCNPTAKVVFYMFISNLPAIFAGFDRNDESVMQQITSFMQLQFCFVLVSKRIGINTIMKDWVGTNIIKTQDQQPYFAFSLEFELNEYYINYNNFELRNIVNPLIPQIPYTRYNSTGIDQWIEYLQIGIFNYLLQVFSGNYIGYSQLPVSQYNQFGRAYRNYKKSEYVPEVYVKFAQTGNFDYTGVLLNDNVSITSFFDCGEAMKEDHVSGMTYATVNCYFFIDLSKLFPDQTQRYDEEIIVLITNFFFNCYGFVLCDVVRGVKSVFDEYNGFKIKKNKIFNQQPNLVFRIGLKKYYDESWNNCPNLIPSGVGGNEFAPQEFDPTEFA